MNLLHDGCARAIPLTFIFSLRFSTFHSDNTSISRKITLLYLSKPDLPNRCDTENSLDSLKIYSVVNNRLYE